MKEKNFSTSFTVSESVQKVFDAISHPKASWSEEIEGDTVQLNSEFSYRYQDVHRSKLKVIESTAGKKLVWHVMENHFSFTKDKREWTDTRLSFELIPTGNKVEVRFIHIGLVPAYECYEICTEAWTNYIGGSLYNLITSGKGEPNPKEGGFNESLIKNHGIKKK